MLNYIWLGIAALLVAADQFVKFWAESSLSQVDTIALIPGVFHLTYVQNLVQHSAHWAKSKNPACIGYLDFAGFDFDSAFDAEDPFPMAGIQLEPDSGGRSWQPD